MPVILGVRFCSLGIFVKTESSKPVRAKPKGINETKMTIYSPTAPPSPSETPANAIISENSDNISDTAPNTIAVIALPFRGF